MVTGVTGGRGTTAQRPVVLELLRAIGRVQTPPRRMEEPNVMEQPKNQIYAIRTSLVHQWMVTGVNGGRGSTAQHPVVLELLRDIGIVQTPPRRMEDLNVMEQPKRQTYVTPTSHAQ